MVINILTNIIIDKRYTFIFVDSNLLNFEETKKEKKKLFHRFVENAYLYLTKRKKKKKKRENRESYIQGDFAKILVQLPRILLSETEDPDRFTKNNI